jgi:hypothetical protein
MDVNSISSRGTADVANTGASQHQSIRTDAPEQPRLAAAAAGTAQQANENAQSQFDVVGLRQWCDGFQGDDREAANAMAEQILTWRVQNAHRGPDALFKLVLRGAGLPLPPQIGQLANLTSLEAHGVSALPQEIGNLLNLRCLDLSESPIESLPEAIGQLAALDELNLSETPLLTTLPPQIGDLTRLRLLRLSDSAIQRLPPEIGRLVRLEELQVNGTRLTTLPFEITNLQALNYVTVSNSGIVNVPAQIRQLLPRARIYPLGEFEQVRAQEAQRARQAFLHDLAQAQNAQLADAHGNATPIFLMQTLSDAIKRRKNGEEIRDAASFLTWLAAIQGSADFANRGNPEVTTLFEMGLRRFLEDVLVDDDLRATCCAIAFEYEHSCEDGAAAAYAEMQKAAVLARFSCPDGKTLRPDVTVQDILKRGVDMFVIDAVERCAMKKILQLRSANSDRVGEEEIATMLRYQTGLRPLLAELGIRLELPNTSMLYPAYSGVSGPEELRLVAFAIKGLYEDGQSLPSFLMKSWGPLAKFVETKYAGDFESLRAKADAKAAEFADQLKRADISEGQYVLKYEQVGADLKRDQDFLREQLMQVELRENLARVLSQR